MEDSECIGLGSLNKEAYFRNQKHEIRIISDRCDFSPFANGLKKTR